MNILNEIAEYSAYRVFTDKREYSLEELKERCKALDDKPVVKTEEIKHT